LIILQTVSKGGISMAREQTHFKILAFILS